MHRGYILERAVGHPNAVNEYVYQHRLVVERSIGRYLLADELIHHMNHIKNDNHLENLEIVTAKMHRREHASVLVNYLGETICWQEAIERLKLDRSSVKSMKKRHTWTHQQTIDHYIKKRQKL